MSKAIIQRTLLFFTALATVAGFSGCAGVKPPKENMWRERPSAAAERPAPAARESVAAAQPAAVDEMDEGQLREELQKARQENQQLSGRAQRVEKRLKEMEANLKAQQEKQQRFEEMMSTNFDLLEQSVSTSLGQNMGQKQPEPAGKAASVAPQPYVNGSAEPAPVEVKKTSGETVGAMAQQEDNFMVEDPDLIPPAHPRKLRDDLKAKPLYEQGFAHFARGRYPEAVDSFEQFLAKFPDNKYSDNAQFWIGESHYKLKAMDKAEEAYRKVLRYYDHRSTLEGYKTPDAIYRLGMIYLSRSNNRRAEYYFGEAMSRFPNSSAALKAKRELDAMRYGTAESAKGKAGNI